MRTETATSFKSRATTAGNGHKDCQEACCSQHHTIGDLPTPPTRVGRAGLSLSLVSELSVCLYVAQMPLDQSDSTFRFSRVGGFFCVVIRISEADTHTHSIDSVFPQPPSPHPTSIRLILASLIGLSHRAGGPFAAILIGGCPTLALSCSKFHSELNCSNPSSRSPPYVLSLSSISCPVLYRNA